jgi:exopolysaccharide biosynthesis operon protein EpsL
VALAGLVLLFLASSPVRADSLDVFNVIASVSRSHDDNIFLLSDGVDPRPFVGRSERWDDITETAIGFRIDKPYSLQRFKFDYTLRDTRHQNYEFLDFKARDYKAAWLWALTPYLTGNLSADQTQTQSGFSDYRGYQRANNVTSESQRFDADFSPHGNWHLLAGVAKYKSTNSQTFNEDSSNTTKAFDGGVRYAFPSGSAFTLMVHERQGDYGRKVPDTFNQLDTGFEERETEARLDWLLSGKSRINLAASYVDHEHDHLSRRDYAEPAGSATYTWTPTGKLQISLSASRSVASFQTSTSSYTTNDTVSLSPVWMATDKINLQASIGAATRKFRGNGVVGAPDIGREDKSKFASLQMSWAPYRAVSFAGTLQHSSRESNLVGLDFDDNTAELSAQLSF